jgi:hypothetical protein
VVASRGPGELIEHVENTKIISDKMIDMIYDELGKECEDE